MVAPTIIGLIVLNIIPIIQTFYLSFFKSGAFGNGNKFVGLDNYNRLIHDPQVWCAVRNTLVYTCMVVPITVIIALLLAVVLNGKSGEKGFTGQFISFQWWQHRQQLRWFGNGCITTNMV